MSYSKQVLDHYNNPRNVGVLDAASKKVGTGMVGAPACGDVMKLQIKVNDNGIIEDARFKTYGCGSAIASSSLLTEWVKGKTLDEASHIKNTEIVDELKLPPVKIHCSVLAEDAINLMENLNYHILFIDLDKMKSINDEYGHNMGDNALIEASKILKSSFREGDIISRYGGDEFMVFVSDVKDDVINKIKDRIDINITLFNKNRKLHYSLGLTVGHSKYDPDKKESLKQVIDRADKDMYNKKLQNLK